MRLPLIEQIRGDRTGRGRGAGLLIALAPNTNGSSRRTSCQAGTAVSAISAAVYVDGGMSRSVPYSDGAVANARGSTP